MTGLPDVTVVVAVYNTMPYLTDCLNSLVEQSIGLDRLEVVAVDDGSTDGSGAELDRFAERFPGTVKVIHQPNSGGPATPSNRALDVATGRFVYFVGSDDHLGREALERLVACADEHGSDVVVGRMVGTNGRYVNQALYQADDPDVSFYDSALPFALANTKLFRRELVERHKLRFPEDLPVGSDQPFTIEACVRARKISVLGDYTYYYAVKRGDASNITYRADHLSRLRCTGRIMEFTAGLIEAGPKRDAVLKRHFTWELAKLVQDDFPALEPVTQRDLCEGIGGLADAYFTDAIRDGMDVKRRVRLCLAQQGAVEELCAAVRSEAEHGAPPFVLEGDTAYARYPGFRDAGIGLSDRCFELIGEAVPGRLAQGTELLSAAWQQNGNTLDLALSVRLPVLGETGSAVVRLVQGAMPASADKPGARRRPRAEEAVPVAGQFRIEAAEGGTGSVVHALVPVEPREASFGVRAFVDLAGWTYEIPLRGGDVPMPAVQQWRGGGRYRTVARVNGKGRMVVDSVALPSLTKVLGSRLRASLTGSKRK